MATIFIRNYDRFCWEAALKINSGPYCGKVGDVNKMLAALRTYYPYQFGLKDDKIALELPDHEALLFALRWT